MDVANLLVQPPESEAWANALIGGGFSLFILSCVAYLVAASAARRFGRKSGRAVRRYVAAGLAFSIGVTALAVGVPLDGRYSQPDPDTFIKSRLFDNYGFTSPDLTWRRIQNSGPDGYIATMMRDGDRSTVKVTLEGNRLSLVGTDGKEIPTNNQSESSK